ncbi:MAG: LLM class flavin-dependent oxidoreductase, partial [Acidimicrobiia bacterium]|nr:LLM class flavin-dependent oxidoreductase [Acidimicrobiia bacterium]
PRRGVVSPGAAPRVAVFFPGQGSRAAAAGRRLYEREPLFRDTLDTCDAWLRPHLDAPLPSLLFEEGAPLDRTRNAQPALVALGHALFVQWRAWGLEPSVLLGHSVGEYTAACAAGIFSLEDALSIVTARGRLMQALPDTGAMAAFFAPEAWAAAAIAARPDALAIAAVNGPSEVVVSGDRAELQHVLARAEREGIHARMLAVSHAFHSPLMRPMLDEFAAVLGAVTFHRPSRPLVANVTGRLVEGDEMSSAGYWLRHILAPVRFGDAVASLGARGERLFLELGPAPVLGPIVARSLDTAAVAHGLAAPEALATLYVHGASIDWAAVHRPFPRRKTALPTYPFQRDRHWLDTAPSRSAARPVRRATATLLGERLPEGAHDAQTITWRADTTRPFLRDHALLGTPVWPIAAQIDLALSAAEEGLALDRSRVTSIEFARTLHSDAEAVQTVLTSGGDLRIYSRHEPHAPWQLNTRARVESEPAPAGAAPLAFSAMFFAAKEEDADDRYRLILDAAKQVDRMGFRSVWVPERHFTDMGSLYPNPSVLHAALARETTRVRLMAGSVVLPLHNPLRVAEEWAMVDNLSGGRVGISLASGWNPHDFVLAPDRYADRYDHLYAGVETLRRLWRGEPWQTQAPSGDTVSLRTYPTPVQRELPLWITAARSPESFRRAGALGTNLLTHLLDQDVETLAEKIAIYRAARAEHGFDPAAGIVTLMCHTFVAPDIETVHRLARAPFCNYLRASRGLLAGLAQARKQEVDLDALSTREFDEFVEFLYERFHSTRALIGTPETCRPLVDALQAAGINEIACLLDFGPPTDEVLAHLPFLDQLRSSRTAAAPVPPAVDLAAVRSRCTAVVPGERFYEDLSAAGVDFTGSLRTLGEVHAGPDEALAEIQPSAERAIVLDACVQALLAAFGDRSPAAPLLVPARVGSVQLHAPLAGRARWAHVRRTSELEGAIALVDDAGGRLLDIEGLEVKRIARPTVTPDLSEWLYDVQWRSLASPPVHTKPTRPWIVLADRRGVGAAWAARHAAGHLLVRRGAVTESVGPGRWTVNPDGGFDELFQRIDPAGFGGILDCWPLDVAADLEPSQRFGIEAATHLVQAMARTGGRSLPRLWIATRAAQSVAGEAPAGLFQAPLWGFAAAMAREHPEWWGGIVDLEHDAAAAGLDAVLADDHEDQIAVRDGQRYVRRIVQAADGAPRELKISPDAVYVVAGGQGGLGLVVSRWLAEQGAARLLLLGRSPADASRLATIGADVEYRQVDITDEAALAEALAGRDIRGVVHAAGTFRDESLLRLNHDLLWDVLGARVPGAWALHRVLENVPLDFFVLCSSFSGLTPPHGQAAYAAAAAFLDALAHLRRASGQPALSIDWGAWSDVGFAASDTGREAHARLEEMGIRRMSPAQGLAALDLVLHRETPPQIAIFPMDLRRAGEADPALEHARLLADLIA